MNEEADYDVVIMGGGLAGLSLTKQLLMQQPELRVAVIEKRSFPVDEAAFKVGESTVEIGAHYLAEVIGLKKHLINDQLPKFGLRFFFQQASQSLDESTEVGGSEFFPVPSYQVDRGRLENHLAEVVEKMGATLITSTRIRDIELGSAAENSFHQIRMGRGDGEQMISARWLVDASGRQSLIKRKLDLREEVDHEINAVWFRIEGEIRVDEWCQDPEWQTRTGKIPRRWLSTNHLLGPGYWVWLIPLSTGHTSIGIVADPRIHPLNEMNRFDKALDWLRMNEPLCASSLERYQDRVKDFLAIKRIAYGCRQVFSSDRWALTGEAGVFLDPFYSPGSDYIGMANSMICRLIREDMAGQSIEHMAPTFQSVYLTLFQNNLLTYQDQYPLFGNPRIMSLKIVWDYALYWSFPALLYFNDKLTEPGLIQSLAKGIEEMRDMNQQMQKFFREWHEIDDQLPDEPVYVDQREVDILIQLNAELKDRLDNEAIKERFQRNVTIMRDLMLEITSQVQRNRPQLVEATAGMTGSFTEPRLNGIFEALNI